MSQPSDLSYWVDHGSTDLPTNLPNITSRTSMGLTLSPTSSSWVAFGAPWYFWPTNLNLKTNLSQLAVQQWETLHSLTSLDRGHIWSAGTSTTIDGGMKLAWHWISSATLIFTFLSPLFIPTQAARLGRQWHNKWPSQLNRFWVHYKHKIIIIRMYQWP